MRRFATLGLCALMGLAFGMSFVLILTSGMSLITADMAAGLLAVLKRTMSLGGYASLVVVGLVGNIAGSVRGIIVGDQYVNITGLLTD